MPYSNGRALMLKQNPRNILTFTTEEQYLQIGDAMVNCSGSDIYDVAVLCEKEILSKVSECIFYL
jgi:hypothetical protein